MTTKQHTNLPARSGVYLITCRETGERYIGASKNMRLRWQGHIANLKAGRGNRLLQAAYQQYGLDGFTVEVLEFVENRAHLAEMEARHIKALEPEYNIAPTYTLEDLIAARSESRTVRIDAMWVPAELHQLACLHRRSLHDEVLWALRDYVARVQREEVRLVPVTAE